MPVTSPNLFMRFLLKERTVVRRPCEIKTPDPKSSSE